MNHLKVQDLVDQPGGRVRRKSSPRSRHGEWADWPFSSESYAPDLENGADILLALEQFEAELLSKDTAVRYLSLAPNASSPNDEILDLKNLARLLTPAEDVSHRFFFINRFLMKSNIEHAPKDSKRLRIAAPAFRLLSASLGIPPAFVGAVARYYQPCGRGSRLFKSADGSEMLDFWYILPVRVQVDCTDNQRSHASSTAGSNQMDPFHYLHLPDEKVDVRGSQIGIYAQYDLTKGRSTILSISFQDGRWSRTVEEPQNRIKDVMTDLQGHQCSDDPFFVHLVYLTSALRWWNNALDSFNNQLIAHEKRLQDQMDNLHRQGENFGNELNKALHTMTAHLHRYGTELGRLADIVADVERQRETFFANVNGKQKTSTDDVKPQRITLGIIQVSSQLRAVNSFQQELGDKTKNILALLFNNIQVSNDKIMVANGKAMNKMLRASRAEAKLSMRLTEEMKKDSVAMKTIALLTVFFLPATSFAAILSMPFFSRSDWMGQATRIWLWIVLTIPSTALAFTFYHYWKSRHDAVLNSKDLSGAEMGEILRPDEDESTS